MNKIIDKDTYQANPLIEAKKNYTTNEAKLFYLALTQIRPRLQEGTGDVEFTDIIIPNEEIVRLFGDNHWYYTELRELALSAAQKTVQIADGKKFRIYPVFQEISYDNDLYGGMKIRFNDAIKPYVLDLVGTAYTKIPVKEVWNLRSAYAIRLLELALQYQNTQKKERIISISDLRHYLGIEKNQYARFTNFRVRVLDHPIEEINRNTKYDLYYGLQKKGTRVTAIRLVLSIKKEYQKGQAKIVSDLDRYIKTEWKCPVCGQELYQKMIRGKWAYCHIDGYKEEAPCHNIYDTVADIKNYTETPVRTERNMDASPKNAKKKGHYQEYKTEDGEEVVRWVED